VQSVSSYFSVVFVISVFLFYSSVLISAISVF